MTTWRDLPWLVLDTETTSVPAPDARIITACVGSYSRDGWKPRNWLLQQDQPIPAEATAINGLTDEMAAKGTDHKEGIQEIRDLVQRTWDEGGVVVAYNAAYDLEAIYCECLRWGVSPIGPGGMVIDPMLVSMSLDMRRYASGHPFIPWRPKGSGYHRLSSLAERRGVALGANAHSADADALATARLAWNACLALPGPDQGVDAAMRWQARVFAIFREKFKERGAVWFPWQLPSPAHQATA